MNFYLKKPEISQLHLCKEVDILDTEPSSPSLRRNGRKEYRLFR
jgi:hypothetical protein